MLTLRTYSRLLGLAHCSWIAVVLCDRGNRAEHADQQVSQSHHCELTGLLLHSADGGEVSPEINSSVTTVAAEVQDKLTGGVKPVTLALVTKDIYKALSPTEKKPHRRMPQ